MKALAKDLVASVASLDPTGIAPVVLDLATRFHEQYAQMQDNKELCAGLAKEVDIVQQIVLDLGQKKQVEHCEKTLRVLKDCLEQCLSLIQAINVKKDLLEKMKSFLASKKNQALIQSLQAQLRSIGELLTLSLSTQTAMTLQEMWAIMNQSEAMRLPAIQACNQNIYQEMEIFQAEVNQMKFSIGSITNGGAIQQGDGSTQSNQFGRGELHQPEVAEPELGEIRVLQKLKAFMQDEEYEGEKTSDFEQYNEILKAHQARLSYKKKQKMHILEVQDEDLSPEEAIKAITDMIASLKRGPFLTPAYQQLASGVQTSSKFSIGSITNHGALQQGDGSTQRNQFGRP